MQTPIKTLIPLKLNVQELSAFGGEPTFREPLLVGRPNIGDKDLILKRMEDLLDRRWLTNRGVYVQEFERKLAQYLGVKHCITVCNATVALEIAIRALELEGEVIVPSFTFVATAHALQWQQVTPVFCDIDPHTHSLDPQCVEKLITPRTTGIIGVHVWGNPCDVDSLTAIAQKHNLKLMFDAAHAFGCSYQGQMIGNFGDAEVFSFHATKFLNSFEGGAIATNNDELAAKILLMENFGFEGVDEVVYIGTNGKMSEPSAAMGLTSLESIDQFIGVNYHNYKLYQKELNDIAGINVFAYDESESSNYQYIVVHVDENQTQISRDHIVTILQKENVIARRYFYPGCHRMEPYRSYFPHAGLLLPHTEKLCEELILLPNGLAVDDEKITRVCQLIRLIVENASTINEQIHKQPLSHNFLVLGDEG
jgi:dTDP-4-amino-4,6-dideoxygalactose transaminase